MDALVEKSVDFAAGLEYDDMPNVAVHAAKVRLIDSVGVGMAAHDAPPVAIARRVAPAADGAFQARLFGRGRVFGPEAESLFEAMRSEENR
jgi:2-methylcitrate dehydratase